MKRVISLLLALVIALSCMVTASAYGWEDAETGYGDVLYFDANSTGWNNYKKVFCHIWVHNGDSFFAWQAKAEICTDGDGDGVWTYDLDAKGVTLDPDILYDVIFSNEHGMQTYNLLMGTECIGDTAYCDGTYYENPEDSSKIAQAAFWRGQDKTVYGPEMCVTSIGNVVGTCMPRTTTAYEMFVGFLEWQFLNAQVYSGKDDQEIIDDTAKALGLVVSDVVRAIDEADMSYYPDWSPSNSTLQGANPVFPVRPELCKETLKVDVDSIWGSNADKIYCHIYPRGEDNAFYKKGDKQEACKKNSDGTWTYDLKANGVKLDYGITYKVEFYSVLPTIIPTPTFDIDINYMDYTLTYKFEETSYVWEYMGNKSDLLDHPLSEPIPTLPEFPIEPENYCIYFDISQMDLTDVVGINLRVGKRRLECDRVYGDIWKADFYKNEIILEEGLTYTVNGEVVMEYMDVWGDMYIPIGVAYPLDSFKINTTYLGYTAVIDINDEITWVHKEYDDFLIGDVDLDSKISVLDATEIQMVLAQIKKSPANFDIIADVDGDGKASVLDATELQFILAGLR